MFTSAQAEENVAPDITEPNKILGSKHDLTSLNQRAGVEAMEGVAFSDYDNACIYCHLPPEEEETATRPGQIEGWNRIRPIAANFDLYNSPSFDSAPSRPNDISLLCLSCHDGTMAVDRVVHTPRAWKSGDDMSLHMKLSATDDLNSCGKCHDGSVAHDITQKAIGTNLSDDHPISIRYAGLGMDIAGFKTPDSPRGFDNGVRLFEGNIECATCHDIHKPEARMLLRTDGEKLCTTCHTN
ncbi:MAG: cytochrome c3 family protein [Pseudomonadota bacterium]